MADPELDSTPGPADPLTGAGRVTTGQRIELRALLLVGLMLALLLTAVVYVMYARGVFEAKRTLVLMTDDSEGIAPGMDMTFAGFPIGEVSQVSLAPDGNVKIEVRVRTKDAHWLRKSSVFTVERGLVGGPRIRAFSGQMEDPQLEDKAVRTVLRGDATAEIPRLMATAREVLGNVQALTASEAALAQSLANVQALTGRLNGPKGALGALMGDASKEQQKLGTALDQLNALLLKLDGMAAKADRQVFGQQGLAQDAKLTLQTLQATLQDARGSLQKVDSVLVEAQGVAANAREGTKDLSALRTEVDDSLRKLDQIISDISRKWPFAKSGEIKLP